MFKKYFIIILLFFPSLLFSQGNYKIKGYIKDAETDLPIEEASIVLVNSKNVAVTDKFGYFELKAVNLPAVIKISHISYNEIEINVDKSDTLPFEIKLNYKVNLLKELNIEDKNIERISKDVQLWAFDYDFFDKNILLLNLKNIVTNSFLYLVNSSGDTISTLDLKKKNIKPVKLFKDCLDNIHVLTKDSAYQVYYTKENGLKIKYPTEISKFEYLLNTCVTSIDSCVYYQYYNYHNFISLAYYINLNNKNKHNKIRVIADSITINNFEERFDRSYYMHLCQPIPCPVSDLQLKYDRYFEVISDTDKYLYLPIFTPLINVEDTLCIFNHFESQIEFYSKTGNFIKKTPIDYHKSKDWVHNILLDDKTNKVYAMFLNESIYTLKEINLKTGTINKTISLPKLPFIEKIKVFDDYVYFLYRSRSIGTEDNKMLYRTRIE